MPDYNALRATAARLIGSFGSGRMVTFYRPDYTGYDPLTDPPAVGETSATVVGVVLPRGANDIATVYDDRTENEQFKLLVPALGLVPFVPQTGDSVEVPGRPGRFGVTDVEPTAPDGDGIFFSVYCERGATT